VIGQNQMRLMNGVKGAKKQSYLFHA